MLGCDEAFADPDLVGWRVCLLPGRSRRWANQLHRGKVKSLKVDWP